MLKLFVVALVLAAVAADLDSDWLMFKAKYQKKYTPEEEPKRKSIWYDNKKYIAEHNKKYELGMSSFYLGENKYADMTSSEHSRTMTGLPVEQKHIRTKVSKIPTKVTPEESLDYRTKGVVTPVKDQGRCSAGWAFSATGAIEGMWALVGGRLMNLSESNLIDCSSSFGNRGCDGGSALNALSYVARSDGIDTEQSYPYTPEEQNCKYQNGTSGISFRIIFEFLPGDEQLLQASLTRYGPIAVTIDASHQSFRFYKGGVYEEPRCSSTQVNHGVLLIGYGTYQGLDYWLVKNSYGTSWGNEGYIMMVRNKNNHCGIATLTCMPRK